MARIPDEEIERLKKEVDLAELVVRSGVALKKAGRRPGRVLPVPRRRHPVAGRHPGRRASGTAWGRARPAGRPSTG